MKEWKKNEQSSDSTPIADQWQESWRTCATSSTPSKSVGNTLDTMSTPPKATSLSKKLPSLKPEQSSWRHQSVLLMHPESWALSSESKSFVIISLKKKQMNSTKSGCCIKMSQLVNTSPQNEYSCLTRCVQKNCLHVQKSNKFSEEVLQRRVNPY